jgi:glycosyltransferase involved in cell wall biosynthesis
MSDPATTESPLKILWFVNIVFPDAGALIQRKIQNKGFWMIALAEQLKSNPGVELTVCTATELVSQRVEGTQSGVHYILLPEVRRSQERRALGLLGWHKVVAECREVIVGRNPDVVVVHGTEYGYGLIAEHSQVPVLVSMQGILNAYYPHFWGDLRGYLSRLRYPTAILKNWFYRFRLPVERRIFAANRFFSGRTAWDRSQMLAMQPDGQYFHEDRILRPEFFNHHWKLDSVRRHTLYTTTTPTFLKGTVCLLEALALLRRTVHDVRLIIGGPVEHRGAGGFIHRRIDELGLSNCVEFAGYMNSAQIAHQLETAHAYVIPSYIENSPNNLAEAQAVGCPSVASMAGGIPSMVTHEVDGLLFNVGDPAVLAYSVQRIFEDDHLALNLSRTARETARRRNDPKKVVAAHLHACRESIRLSRPPA